MKKNRKYRADRALLQNTHGSPKSSFNVKKYKPGIHKSKTLFSTTYGSLLIQRQRLRAFFKNIKGKQMLKLIKSNLKYKDYKSRIITALCSRLDNILFRSGFVKSFGMARQIVNHGKVFVNDIKIKSCSFKVEKDSSIISFKPDIETIVKNSIKKSHRKTPSYLQVNTNDLKIKVNSNKYPKHEKELYLSSFISIDNVIRSYKL